MDIARRRKFVVCPGCSVIGPNHQLIRAGTVVSSDQFPSGWTEAALRDGHIKPVEVDDDLAPPPAITPEAPGRDETAPAQDGRDHESEKDQTAQVVKISGDQTTAPATPPAAPAEQPAVNPVVPAATTVPSPWVLDPARLKNKTLHQLNTMVAERDPTIAPFPTVAEAAAFLSKDFKRA